MHVNFIDDDVTLEFLLASRRITPADLALSELPNRLRVGKAICWVGIVDNAAVVWQSS